MSDVNLLGKMVRLTELKFDFLKLQPSGSQPVPDSSTLALVPCDQAVRYLCSNSALDSLDPMDQLNAMAFLICRCLKINLLSIVLWLRGLRR